MHQALRIPEILLNIFGYLPPPATLEGADFKPDLAALARTCKAFKEPALDVLWEELPDLSPLARCLPEACQLPDPTEILTIRYLHCRNHCYSFSRPLNQQEWNTLRGYTHRVQFIRGCAESRGALFESAIRAIFNEAPFADPLFPKLRSLYWLDIMPFPLLHAAVPSLTSLNLSLLYAPRLPTPEEFIDAFGDRCPHMEKLEVHITLSVLVDSVISRQLCRWQNLQHVDCRHVALNMATILHLSSLPNLKLLHFSVELDTITQISNLRSILVFSNLVDLNIRAKSWGITSLLSRIRLPAIKILSLAVSEYGPRQAIHACWTAIQEACPSNSLTSLQLFSLEMEPLDPSPSDEEDTALTLEDLLPCITAFGELRKFDVNLSWSVNLTDDDLLELVSPQMEEFAINSKWGWMCEGGNDGISLSGLVQLLKERPSLHSLCAAIETRTFTEIPEGLDVWFPPRKLNLDFVDSDIEPDFVPGLVSVFTTLGLDPSTFKFWKIFDAGFIGGGDIIPLWESVQDELKKVFKERSLVLSDM